VIKRARTLLRLLEGGDLAGALAARGERRPTSEQLPLFAPASHPVLDRLRELNPETLTPLAALQLLAELRDEVRGKESTGTRAG
jgi:DNA mismatch repair protein MutS